MSYQINLSNETSVARIVAFIWPAAWLRLDMPHVERCRLIDDIRRG